MKKVIVLISFLCGAFFVSAQQGNQQQRQQERWKPESTEWYHPVPPKVTPGVGTSAPSDAIILFDGKDLTKWEAAGKDGGSAMGYKGWNDGCSSRFWLYPYKRVFW